MTTADIILAIHQTLPGWILLIFLLVGIIASAIMVLVFFYHWDNYGTNSIMTLQLKAVYLLGSAAFLALAIFSLLAY